MNLKLQNVDLKPLSLTIMLPKVIIFYVILRVVCRLQTRCVLATWSLCVRTEPSACFSLWSVTASNTVKTDLTRTPRTLDVVRNLHLRKPHLWRFFNLYL